MAEQIDSIALHEAAQARYLNYALSVITSRALPDVRDGFKPVQRRILYSMYHDLRLTKDSKHRKSAAVVGSVMAKYHPHGDQSIYDAMVRMAQSFSLRYPLVDGQGNFGSLDGDGAAAMRYTEARLESITGLMLEELKKKTVALRPNYDGQFFEPVVLPSMVPQLLLNGTTGIAVGMATNIPPHNLREVIKACVQLIDRPDLETADLMKFVRGPDFPVGGRLLNSKDELLSIYETGSGALKVVGEWVEETGEANERLVVITSIPFNVNKAQLVEKIADHIRAGKLPQLVDVRDESTDEIRVVVELSKGASAHAAMAYLFKHTNLQNRFHVNLTCLVPRKDEVTGEETMVPARISLKEVLHHFLQFRFEVVTKRLRFDLEQLERRIHLLEAFAAIFGGLDEALALIRKSRDKKDAAEKLMKRFELDEIQVEAILETRLYKLARLEIKAIRQELREKKKAAGALRVLLASDDKRWSIIKEELRSVARKHGDKRRTSLGVADEVLEFNAEDYIVREDAVVIVTREGWLKRQRSYSDINKLRVRENDEVGWVFRTMTHHGVILFTNRGQVYTLRADGIPATSGYGEPVQAHFDFKDGEKIVGVASTDPRCAPGATDAHWEGTAEADPPDYHMIAITRSGNAVRFGLDAFEAPSTRAGRMFIRLKDAAPDGLHDGVVSVLASTGVENVCLATYSSRAMLFPTSDIPLVKGRGRGVTAISLEGKDVVLAFCLSTHRREGLEVETNRGRKEIIRATKFPVTRRGRKGRPIVLRGHLAAVVLAPIEIKPPETSSLAKATGSSSSKAEVKVSAPKVVEEAEVIEEATEVDPSVVAAAVSAVSEVSTPPQAVYNNGQEPRAPDPDEEEEGDEDQMTLF